MFIFKTKTALRSFLQSMQKNNRKVGFIPTMGALHEGHLSLIKTAKAAHDITICSIFVNPTQFNNPEDLTTYPRTESQDIDLLEHAGCEVLFLPETEEIYPKGMQAEASFDLGYLESVLEGAFRPGHFQGVAQVVSILLEIVQPDNLYLGQKDYQQYLVLSKLIAQQHLPVHIFCVPTLREADGLAMSSRNQRLTPAQRAVSNLIYQCLVSIQAKAHDGDFAIVQKECKELLERKGIVPEYIALADADTLELFDNYHPERKMIALIAGYAGKVRLIDNMLL